VSVEDDVATGTTAADGAGSAPGGLRDRRRAQTVQEIKDAALRQLSEEGAGALSLRGVAREVGVTVQSLYHYFDSRDALLTALVIDAHNAVADAVLAAATDSREEPPLERRLAATRAYRDWATDHRAEFLLIYGTPVPGFQADPSAGTSTAAWRLAAPFADVLFGSWTPAQLAALPAPPAGAHVPELAVGGRTLPPAAVLLFLELRARMHGVVVLDLLGHLHPLEDHGGLLFEAAMRRMSAELDLLRDGGSRTAA
jgi:AcrR family transcriptional regulator